MLYKEKADVQEVVGDKMKKRLTFGKALIPLLGLIAAAACSIFIWDAGMNFPLIIGVILVSIIAVNCGWEWNDVQKMMVNGVSRTLPAVFILSDFRQKTPTSRNVKGNSPVSKWEMNVGWL